MSGLSIKTTLEGVPQFVRALQRTDKATQGRVIDAVERGTNRVAAGARARVPRRSGELAETIRAEFSKDRLTGFVKSGYGRLIRRSRAGSAEARAKHSARRQKNRDRLAKAGTSKQALSAIDLGVYAPVVERGDPKRHKPAHPFTIPALRQETPSIMADLAKAPHAAAEESGL